MRTRPGRSLGNHLGVSSQVGSGWAQVSLASGLGGLGDSEWPLGPEGGALGSGWARAAASVRCATLFAHPSSGLGSRCFWVPPARGQALRANGLLDTHPRATALETRARGPLSGGKDSGGVLMLPQTC